MFDVNPICCGNNQGDTDCKFAIKSLCTWKNLYLTMCGLYKLQCHEQYCVVHKKHVERKVLLQLCLDKLGLTAYKSGYMITSLGMKSFIQNIFVLQTNISVVVNVINIYLMSVIHDRINIWKSIASQPEIDLLVDVLNDVTDEESKEALDSMLVKRQQIANYCDGLSNDLTQLAHALFNDSLITDCRKIGETLICQINCDATFDAAENTTNGGKTLRSVIAGFCTNNGKVSYPPTMSRSENTKLFVTVLTILCCKVLEYYYNNNNICVFLFLFVLDDTKSYVNLPNQVTQKVKEKSVVNFKKINLTILLAEDRMHRVGRWYRQMPKTLHQWGLFVRCISAHHARAEKGMLTLTSNTTMTVDEYICLFETQWKPQYDAAKTDICQLIVTLTKIEDNKFSYTDDEYDCTLKCKQLFEHAIDHLGWLASTFFAREILFKGSMSPEQLNVTIELLDSKQEYITTYACALPTFIFLKLVKKCGCQLPSMCWQSDEHCFWGYMNIYHIAKCIWSDHDSASMASQYGFMKRLALDIEPMAIRHLMNNRYNTSNKSGTAVTIERLHGYYNSHHVKAQRCNVQHTMNSLNIQAYKKTKIAIYDESHKTNNHSSQWHQVTVLDARKNIIKILKSNNHIQKPNKMPYRNMEEELKAQDIQNQYTAKNDRKRRYEVFEKNDDNATESIHRRPIEMMNAKLTNNTFYLICI